MGRAEAGAGARRHLSTAGGRRPGDAAGHPGTGDQSDLAARYADRLVAMRDGRIAAAGEPGQAITEALFAEVFGLAARVIPDPVVGAPLLVPVGGHTPAPR
jgi:hypothetical protein